MGYRAAHLLEMKDGISLGTGLSWWGWSLVLYREKAGHANRSLSGASEKEWTGVLSNTLRVHSSCASWVGTWNWFGVVLSQVTFAD